MSVTTIDQQTRTLWSTHQCVVCGSKAIGVNFGALTCAPCKAFFRRNGRRKEVFETPCYHRMVYSSFTFKDYLQIRRCAPCRLLRCFAMGMKEELVRTHEENVRHKQLVNTNRQQRELVNKKQQDKLTSIPQCVTIKNQFLRESDWRHLSNIVSAYETCCLKVYVQQRSTISNMYERIPIHYATALSMNLSFSLFSFLRSLPAFHSLSQIEQIYLCKYNFRSLIFPNLFELKQTCYSEQWQISLDKATLQWICGPELYEQFLHIENLAERLLITDSTVTRLWLIVLFLSSSLTCYYEANRSVKIPIKNSVLPNLRNAYITLLWNYLLHRYGDDGAVQIYSNLVYVYMKMQRVAFDISMQVRTRNELITIPERLDQVLSLNILNS